jgi:NADPH:quinone reductase-like Zn-dependent oxidoreductase
MFISKEHHAYLETLSEFIEAGRLTPIIDKAYPLAGVPDVMRHLEGGQARGKIAITI